MDGLSGVRLPVWRAKIKVKIPGAGFLYHGWEAWCISPRMASRLNGKWVLITGASSGFGAAAAQAFAAEGCRLLLGARRRQRLEEVAAITRKAGAPETHAHPLDVASTESVNQFLDWARTQISSTSSGAPGLYTLINNAGGALGLDPVAVAKDEDWEAMFQSNVLGILRMIRATLPLLPHHAGATIINVGSYAARAVYEGGAAYCAAKAGELQISRALRLELSGTGIRVCSIDPGLAKTEFSLVRFKGDHARAEKPYEGTQPLLAEDIAEIFVWVASRPPHVNIDEMLIKPTDQAAMHKVFRRPPSPSP
jgi:3-hydroxy acid dehydrogenase/malonic semialdehyde reductase